MQDYIKNDTAIEATLLGGHKVFIDPESVTIGGAWQGKDATGKPAPWDPDVLNFFFEKTSLLESPFILDVGANTGIYCLLPAINPAIKCFAFEPNPNVYRLLKKNIALNNLADNIQTFPLALSNKTGAVSLKIPASGKDSGLACLGAPKRFDQWHEITVPTDMLDNIISRQKIQHIDLIKIDTEGCELFVLLGAEQCIREFKPDILLEFEERNTAQFGYHPDSITALLASWGYSFKKISNSDAFFSIKSSTKTVQTPANLPLDNTMSSLSESTRENFKPLPITDMMDINRTKLSMREQLVAHYHILSCDQANKGLAESFFSKEAIAINVSRLAHLEGLGLPLEKKDVLEVGSGVGMLTKFFEDKYCKVISTEARTENIMANIKMNPQRSGRVWQSDLTVAGSHDAIGSVDVVFCYGTLYHLFNPEVAIRDLARVTRELLLLETCVFWTDNNQINLTNEQLTSINQAFSVAGCRPGRDWVFTELKKYFPYVYVTTTQPDHDDFPLSWPAQQNGILKRSVFVASRRSIESKLLTPGLPTKQTKYVQP